MRKKIFLSLAVIGSLMTLSCEKEQITPNTNSSVNQEFTAKKGTIPVVNSTSPAVISNLNLCGNYLSTLGAITNSSGWNIGSSSVPGYIDYELTEAFRCAYDFATCHIRFPGPPTSIHQVEFSVFDPGQEVVVPGVGFETQYVLASGSNGISAATAEQLKEHFACVIKEYQNASFAGSTSYVNNVTFHGDALLCTCPSGSSRYLTATVTYYVF